MTHERPYREPWAAERACQAIVEGGGQAVRSGARTALRGAASAQLPASASLGGRRSAVLEALPLRTGGADGDVFAGPLVDPLYAARGSGAGSSYDVGSRLRATTSASTAWLIEFERSWRRVNVHSGFVAGDRMVVRGGAGDARRAAGSGRRHRLPARAGAAWRSSCRRGAARRRPASGDEVRTEFLDGPEVEVVEVVRAPGEPPEALLDRARAALRDSGG